MLTNNSFSLNADNLEIFFLARINECNSPILYGEGYTIGLFDDLKDKITPESAFKLIPTAIQIILANKDKEAFAPAIALLSTLIRITNTTQQPTELLSRWDELQNAVKQHLSNSYVKLAWNWLCEWYRIKQN